MVESNLSSRPGVMTSVMRAVQPAGPKVLRVGVAQNGQIKSEVVFSEAESISVGPSERSRFVVPGTDLRQSHVLFQHDGKGYKLRFSDSMTGRVALSTGVSNLDQLRPQAARSSGGIYEIALSDESRGKITIGSTTFLFQFVEPPPQEPRPQLPRVIVTGATTIDWPTTIIAAIVFFAHFMFIGALYSSWLDPVVDQQRSLEGLVETLDRIPQPALPEPEPEAPSEEATEEVEAPQEAPKVQPKQQAPARPAPGQPISKETQNFLADKAAELQMKLLAVRSAAGSAAAQVLQEGDTSLGSMDAQARADTSIGTGGGLDVAGASGPIARDESKGLGDLVKNETAVASNSGQKAETAGPVVRGTTSASGQVAAGKLNNAARVVAMMNGCFRGAYNAALQSNPDISGSVALLIKVSENGSVSSVSPSGANGLPSSLVSRLVACAQRRKFDPPEGGSALLRVPVSLVKQ